MGFRLPNEDRVTTAIGVAKKSNTQPVGRQLKRWGLPDECWVQSAVGQSTNGLRLNGAKDSAIRVELFRPLPSSGIDIAQA